ncbi:MULTISPECIES: LysR family transcriptional regulator [unclassified Acidovorax]|uniref:LysR family transcriptional regulator n=1 Tax=unclassified Acidovorax TaxID=2684926 RepID=UPI001C44C45E|nr:MULTISPECIES: LysR family transcriptional regulator [unclassified Acidovorax]MBV7431656.1 LysR family transcriptional regulator [Acidovorax sp. sif0732]MBV7452780.1 LysR family transcriptional regulator [Acidovorax sp. sif0715]
MDFKQLRAFLTVAETGNVTRAADVLHLVQPAVSRQVRLLEEDVGVQLFERERHGMVLTEAGQTLAAYARRAMLELDRARAEMSSAGSGISGLVTLGLLPSTIDIVSSALLSAINHSYPDVRVRIAMGYAGTLARWLETGEIDAALLYGAERSSGIQVTPLVEEALWVIGLPDAGLVPELPVKLASLATQKMILPSAPHGIRSLVEHACAVAHVTLNLSAETNALSVQRSLVLGGHGLTILPPIAVAEDLRTNLLSGAPLGDPEITRTIVLGLPDNRPTARHVRCAVDLLIGVVQERIEAGAWPQGRWLRD